MTRPIQLSIAAVVLIILGAIALVGLFALSRPEIIEQLGGSPTPVQYATAIVGALALLLAGWGAWVGRNWTRLVFALWAIVSVVLDLVNGRTNYDFWISMAIYAVLLVLLFLPSSDRWYGKGYFGKHVMHDDRAEGLSPSDTPPPGIPPAE